MTTSVTVKHDGPGHHDVLVVVYREVSGEESVTQYSRRLRKDESSSFLLYKGQFIKVLEVNPLEAEVTDVAS